MKKKIIICMAIILPIAIVLYLIYNVKAYLDEVPTIVVKEQQVFSANSEISVYEIAQIEKAQTIKMTAQWADESTEEIYVDSEKQLLQIGNRTGECHVFIVATGENAETRDAKVTISIE